MQKLRKSISTPKPVDIQNTIDGHATLVEMDIKVAVFDPLIFVLLNKPGDRMKILYRERKLSIKNEFGNLPRNEIAALQIPDTVEGILLSPFQLNECDGYLLVPTEAFKEMTDLLTDHAQAIHAEAVAQSSK